MEGAEIGGIRIFFVHPHFEYPDIEVSIVRAIFFVSPKDNPGQHLRILARPAGRVDDESIAMAISSFPTVRGLLKSWPIKDYRYA